MFSRKKRELMKTPSISKKSRAGSPIPQTLPVSAARRDGWDSWRDARRKEMRKDCRRSRGDFAPDGGDAATAEGPGWEGREQGWGCSRTWGAWWRGRETPTAQGQERGK